MKKGNNPSGKTRQDYPPEIAKLRQELSERFAKEADEKGLHGYEREKARMRWMYNNFHSKLRLPKVYAQVGAIVISQLPPEKQQELINKNR